MKYNFKDLIIESEFDIFDVKFIEFYGDFFELYYEKDGKFYQFYVYESESEDDETIKTTRVVFKKYSAYQNMITNYKSKLNFFEFIEYISHKNYNKKLFNTIKDKLRNDYVEFLI